MTTRTQSRTRRSARRRRAPLPTSVARIVGIGAVAGVVSVAAVVPMAVTAGASVNAARDYVVALPAVLPKEQAAQRSVILAADGSKIGEFFSENRRNIRIDQVSPIARKAIVAIEDDRFYTHGPIDVRGTLRAFVNNSADGGGRQGGSTLTQQYVKNVLLNAAVTKAEKKKATEISLHRKVQEAKLAAVAEQTMSKDQILEGYLNIAYFGDGAYGIESAAQHYFSVPASALTLGQAAVLAGLVQNPEGYAPTEHPKTATIRRNLVLARMRDTGAITKTQAAAAQSAPLGLRVSQPENGCRVARYPFYCQFVRNILSTSPVFGASTDERRRFVNRGGLTIKTHLQPAVMDKLQTVADESMGPKNSFATAMAAVQPGTGQVVGFAQSRSWAEGEVILPTSAFQPGSTFKPVTYAAALENGFALDGALDAPEKFTAPDSPQTIRNDSKADVGRMDANTAMARSSNTWFATLEAQVGVLEVKDMAQRLGMTFKAPPVTSADYSLTLGTREQSPLTMASVYAALAAHGRLCSPVAIASITDADGQPVDVPDAGCHQAVRAGIADAVTTALAQVVDGKDDARTGKGLGIGRPVAAKSGTNENASGVWFTGFTPQIATSVWVGDPKAPVAHKVHEVYVYGQPRSGYGAAAAGPIWQNAMKALTEGLPVEQFAPVGPAEVTGATSVIPDLRGLSTAQAIQVAHAAGLDIVVAPRTAPPSGPTPKDVVVTQTPAAGTTTGVTGTVTVTLSAGSAIGLVVPHR